MEPILALDLATLRRRTSMKWQRHPDDVLPLWVAEMDTPLPPGVRAELQRVLDEGDTGYPAGNGYAEAWADFAAAEWGSSLDPGRAVLSPDVMQGVAMVLGLLAGPGERLVINSPVYPPFWAAVGHCPGELLDVALTPEGRLDLAALAEAYADPATRVHLLSNPHNPTGVVHTPEELAELVALAARHDVWLVSDEIHAPLVAGDIPFTPLLDLPGAEQTVAVVSASKAWNLAGLKGALLLPGSGARELLGRLSYEQTRGAASHVALRAHSAALHHDRDWLHRLRVELQANRELLQRLLAERLPEVTWRPTTGTYLAWLDCRALGLRRPAGFFLREARVALNDGADFGPASDGFVRLNLATTPAIVELAVARMAEALSRRQ